MVSVVKDLQPGDPRVIGPYRVVGRLGQGGMGQVFLAVSPGGRPVAVKAIRPELASNPQFRTRFAREVDAARTVSGMYTAMVVGADVDGPIAWLATAYVPGPTLAEAIDEHGPLPEASVLGLAAGLAEALAAIHAAGLTHRDLKPSNVLLAEDGPRVIDFGISRAAESAQLTQTGLTMGSPGFMSPEQAMGRGVGPPSDIFSLGTVLAFAATGEGPFGTGTTMSLLYRVVHEPPDLDRVPPAMRPLIERCLVKDPAQRPTAAALLDAVGALQPTGNWLPASVIGMAAAPPIPTHFPGMPAPTPADAVHIPPRTTSADVVPFQPAPTSVDALAILPYGATETSRAPTGGPPPLITDDPPPDQSGGPRRRWLVVLASIIGVLAIAGVATAFAFGSHNSKTPPPSRPAAEVTSVASPTTTSASASPTASKPPKPSASPSTHAATTQPTTRPQPTVTSPTTTQTHTTTPTPTPTTTTPTPTKTTTSPTPTTTTTTQTPTPTATASSTSTATSTATATTTTAPASSTPSASASST